MNFKYIAAAALLSTAFVTGAQATVVTTTSSGTISYGTDGAGLFGAVGANLSGQHYQMAISLDIDQNQYHETSTAYSYDSSYGSAPFTISATVNNTTFSGTYNTDAGSQQFVSNGFTQHNGNRPYDEIYGYGNGYSAGFAEYVSAIHYLYSSSTAFEDISMSLLDSLTHSFTAGDGGGASFQYNSDGYQTYFGTTPDSISLNGGADVPEPATLGIFALGLAGLAAARRKRAQR